MSLIIEAAQFANECHKGQFRNDGITPYIVHPVRIAGRIIMHEVADEELVAAAYLHDVVEDCGIEYKKLVNKFGIKVTGFVRDLTNTSKLLYPEFNRSQRKHEDCARISAVCRESKIIKLIDRIDNLNDLDNYDGFAKQYAEESILLSNALKETDEILERELNKIIRRILDY